MTQRHLEPAFLPSGNCTNTVESWEEMLSLSFEGLPVHYCSMCPSTHIMETKTLNEGADVAPDKDSVT